jgi:hypothetical protein
VQTNLILNLICNKSKVHFIGHHLVMLPPPKLSLPLELKTQCGIRPSVLTIEGIRRLRVGGVLGLNGINF